MATRDRSGHRHRRGLRLAVALAVVAASFPVAAGAWPASDEPQAESQSEMPAAEPVFRPVLFVLGSVSNNEFRSSTDPVSDSSVYAEVDLPFVFVGPRWQGGFSLRPGMRKYRDHPDLDDFRGGGDVWLSGSLSPRTSLSLRASGSWSPELSSLDSSDLIVPRADRVRGRAHAELRYRLSAVDTLSVGAEYELIDYLDNDFEGVQQASAIVGLSKGVGPRFAFTAAARGDRLLYEIGGSAAAVSGLGGFDYALGPRTTLEMQAGLSWITGDQGPDSDVIEIDRRSLAFRGELRHSGPGWITSLRAERRLGSGVALGTPTILTQASASLDLAGLRWRLGVLGSLARNELLDEGGGTLLSANGLLPVGERVDTAGVCVDAGYRLTRWLSVVGAGRYDHQVSAGGAERLDIDVYRLSVGFGFHPAAPSLRPRAGGGAAASIDRYRRFATLGSC